VPDLNKYSVAVKNWKVTQEDSGVRIDAEAEHTVNEKNSFTVAYTYHVGRDGALRVEYTVRPHVEFAWLPEIGVEFAAAEGLDNLRWLDWVRSMPTQREDRADLRSIRRPHGQRYGEGHEGDALGRIDFRPGRRLPRGKRALHPGGRAQSAGTDFGGRTFREGAPSGTARVPSRYRPFSRI